MTATATRREKTTVPAAIEQKMKLWRQGLSCLPVEYINFHRGLAQQERDRLQALGYVVHHEWMEGDGWYDGMKVLHLVVEWKDTARLAKIHWHDGNQQFFIKHQDYCGSSIFDPEEFATKGK